MIVSSKIYFPFFFFCETQNSTAFLQMDKLKLLNSVNFKRRVP